MRVAIVGFGVEGESSLKYWQSKGADVTVCDKDPDKKVPDGAQKQLGDVYLDGLDRFDIIMRTAGMHPKIILEKNPGVADKITTTINEFLRVCPTKNVIGVTGTKGKGTTSTLIAKMLEASSKHVVLGGNIGTSPLDFLPELTQDSWIVLELSSFQLFDLKRSPHIAACLMIAPEHLDWHEDEQDYFRAKMNLFSHQASTDVAIYFADNLKSHEIASASPGDKIAYYDEPGAYVHRGNIMIDQTVLCKTSELKLFGEHNWQNACAAATVLWQVMQDPEPIRKVLTTFTGLPHRLEFVREIDHVKYYDDSFGTTPETAAVAIEAFKEPKVVILGGSDKGTSFGELARTIKKNNVRRVVLIGQTAPKIQAALKNEGYASITPGGKNMTEIIATAQQFAQPGDVVLLSPACASFDMFKNYKDRAAQFRSAVQEFS